MTQDGPSIHWQTDGKFLRSGSSRVFPLCVTYGPFPGGWPVSFDADFARITAAGFHALDLGPRVLRSETAPLAVLAWLALQQPMPRHG